MAKPPASEKGFEADILDLLAKVRALAPLCVANALRDPHSLVRATRADHQASPGGAFDLAPPPRDGCCILPLDVDDDNFLRALRFINTLIRAIELLGERVEIKSNRYASDCYIAATFCGEEVPLRLRERWRQEAPSPAQKRTLYCPKRISVRTGEFVLDRLPGYDCRPYAQDSLAEGRIECQINEILIQLVTQAGHNRIARRKSECERQRYEDQERLRREKAERERAEQDRVNKLQSDAEAWRRATTLREFIGAVEQLAIGKGLDPVGDTKLAEWLAWSRQHAEELDPVAKTLTRLTAASAE